MPRQARKKAESGIYHSCGHDKAVKLVAELDNGKGIGLIERKKQGQGRPTKIYVKRSTSSQTSESRKSRLPKIRL